MAIVQKNHHCRTQEEVTAILEDRGIPGYSETYIIEGPSEIELANGEKVWKIVTKTYQG